MNNQPTILNIINNPEVYQNYEGKSVRLIDKTTNEFKGEIVFRLKKFVNKDPLYLEFLNNLKVEILSPENSPEFGGKYRKSRRKTCNKSRKSRKNKSK